MGPCCCATTRAMRFLVIIFGCVLTASTAVAQRARPIAIAEFSGEISTRDTARVTADLVAGRRYRIGLYSEGLAWVDVSLIGPDGSVVALAGDAKGSRDVPVTPAVSGRHVIRLVMRECLRVGKCWVEMFLYVATPPPAEPPLESRARATMAPVGAVPLCGRLQIGASRHS